MFELPSLSKDSSRVTPHKNIFNKGNKFSPPGIDNTLGCPSDDEKNLTNELTPIIKPPLHPVKSLGRGLQNPSDENLAKSVLEDRNE